MRTTTWTLLTLTLLLTGGAVLLTGCAADKVTRENFALVRQDMATQADVEHILGAPTERLGNNWYYERHDRGLDVLIEFDDAGRVVRKQWIDSASREWIDSAEH